MVEAEAVAVVVELTEDDDPKYMLGVEREFASPGGLDDEEGGVDVANGCSARGSKDPSSAMLYRDMCDSRRFSCGLQGRRWIGREREIKGGETFGNLLPHLFIYCRREVG